MQDRVVIFDSRVGFSGTAYLMASFKFAPWMTPVAMATKFGTKSAITQFIEDTSARSLCITGGFQGRSIK